jgi:hypothetical protein
MAEPYECSFEPKNGAETQIPDDGVECVILPTLQSCLDLVIKLPKGNDYHDYQQKFKNLPVKIHAIRLFLKRNGTAVGNKQYEQDDVLKLQSFEDGECRYEISKYDILKYMSPSHKRRCLEPTAIIFDLKFPNNHQQRLDLFLRPNSAGTHAKRIPSFQVVLNDPKLQHYWQDMMIKSFHPSNLQDTSDIIRNYIPSEGGVPINDEEEENFHNSMDTEVNDSY